MKLKEPLSLPVTRKKQIKFVFRTNFALFFKLSLIVLVFASPFFAQLFYLLMAIGPILNKDGADANEKISLVCNLFKVVSLFTPITFGILAIGIAGASNIFKKLLYNDGFMLKRDFFLGIKDGRQGIYMNIVLGLLVLVWNLGVFSFGTMELYTWFIILLVVSGILLLITPIIFFYNSVFPIYYSCSFFQLMKNSLIFTFHTLGVSMGLFLLGNCIFISFYLVDFILFSRITYLSLTGLFIELIFFGIFTHYLLQEYAVSRFDENINRETYPDMYRKGLYKEEDENE